MYVMYFFDSMIVRSKDVPKVDNCLQGRGTALDSGKVESRR